MLGRGDLASPWCLEMEIPNPAFAPLALGSVWALIGVERACQCLERLLLTALHRKLKASRQLTCTHHLPLPHAALHALCRQPLWFSLASNTVLTLLIIKNKELLSAVQSSC